MYDVHDPTIQIIRAFIIVGGVPLAIYLAKTKEISRSVLVRNFAISIAGFMGGIIAGDALLATFGSAILAEFGPLMMCLSWWFLYYSMAMRMTRVHKNRWLTLWAMIPIVLMVMLPYLMLIREEPVQA